MVTICKIKGGTASVEAYSVTLPDFPTYQFVAHQTWSPEDPAVEGLLSITELTTGCVIVGNIAGGEAAAIKAANDQILKAGKSEFLRQLNSRKRVN